MPFEIARTTALFSDYNRHTDKEKGRAMDMPFTITLEADNLDMLAPAQPEEGETDYDPSVLINELFSAEGFVRRPSLNPLHINRKPEGATITIWDFEHPKKKDEPIVFDNCTLKGMRVTLKAPHQIVLKGKIEILEYTDKELIRLDHVCGKTFDLAISVRQDDLFDSEAEENDDDAEQQF